MGKEYTKVKMKLPVTSTGDVKIVIDEIDITDKVRKVEISAEAGELTKVSITFGAGVDLEGEAILHLRDCADKELGSDNED